MDLFKRHYEKLLLAVALLVLILTAVFLAIKVNQLRNTVENTPAYLPPKRRPITPVNMAPYQQELDRIRKPVQWTTPAASMFPPPDISTNAPTVITNYPTARVTLRQVIREEFRLRLNAYTWDAETKQGRMFQINFPRERRTYFVTALGQAIEEPGVTNRYLLTEFRRKFATVTVPGMGPMEQDVSELTIQRSGDKPIVLILGRVTEPNPEVQIQCGTDPQWLRLGLGATFDCNGRTYKVVDIAPTQVVIEDLKNGEKQTVPLTP